MSSISIINGRVIDPANNIDEVIDLHIQNTKILALGHPPSNFTADEIIDAKGKHVIPGLIDLCARLREPGDEHKATIASESKAAVSAGVTTICIQPDTDPVIDTRSVVELIHQKAQLANAARIVCTGALTAELNGTHLSEMAELKNAGCVAVSNANQPINNTQVLRRAMDYASNQNIPVIIKPEDDDLAASGCAHDGVIAARLGLTGIPEAAETAELARCLELIAQTKTACHFSCLSCQRSANMIGRAQHDGLAVTADVAIHQLFLTEHDLNGFNAQCHVRPPFRTVEDRDGLRQAVLDGKISAICSDHQPHDSDAKSAPFPSTEAGISSIELLLPLLLKLTDELNASLSQMLDKVTAAPAKILGLETGTLGIGKPADVCIYDPQKNWTITAEELKSQGKNTPFTGWEMNGQVTQTLVNGRLCFQI
ncbi:MAG: dihydroorotase [Gammaproteobacteria bacterium]|nr:dihydroorotase [Gammaproteobacteria bacterium]